MDLKVKQVGCKKFVKEFYKDILVSFTLVSYIVFIMSGKSKSKKTPATTARRRVMALTWARILMMKAKRNQDLEDL